jgi:allantoinase
VLNLRSNRVVTPDGIRPASIHVRDGRIDAIRPHAEGAGAIDYGELVIMPGVVDSHVHVNEPGRTEWEGFESATRAAAAGGVTTIVDMPLNSVPATTSVAALETKIEAMSGKCHVDVGLWGGAVPGNNDDLLPMLERGALGFKCFLVDSGVPEFGFLTAPDLELALRTLSGTGAPLLVHAELPGPIANASVEGRPAPYRNYLSSRPEAAETEAIELLRRLCAQTGARAHVVHLSAAEGIDIVRQAKRQGVALSAETTPHYLHLEAESIPDGATEFKCAPPIRDRGNRERLWKGLTEGVIELVVSDHSPCTPELKQGDFRQAWGGISSVQFTLPIVWTEARRRGHDLPDIVRWLCEAPARLARLEGRKGRIAPGCDADIAVFDPEASFTVESTHIHHRHKVTPYAGETFQGVVRGTYVRGQQVYADGSFGEPIGQWVK